MQKQLQRKSIDGDENVPGTPIEMTKGRSLKSNTMPLNIKPKSNQANADAELSQQELKVNQSEDKLELNAIKIDMTSQ